MKLFLLPELWVVLFTVFGPGIELFPSMRAFRAEQTKYRRFEYIPGHRRAKLWLIPAWIVPPISIGMCTVSILYGMYHESWRNLFLTLFLIPWLMCAERVIKRIMDNRK